MQKILHGVVILTLVLALFSGCARRDLTPSLDETAPLKARIESNVKPEFVRADKESLNLWKIVTDFYSSRNYRPIWVERTALRPHTHTFIATIEHSSRSGLNPADYDFPEIVALRETLSQSLNSPTPDLSTLADFELRLSYVFLRYSAHLLHGRFPPGAVNPNWPTSRKTLDLSQLLETAPASGRIEETLRQIEPAYPEYVALQRQLTRYRDIASQGGWLLIPENVKLRKTDADPSVALIRNNLALTGDLSSHESVDEQDPTYFDEALEQGVRRFKARHGLKADGVVDHDFVAAMNISPESRVRQIEINLERWRWLPDNVGSRHIRINIPSFTLDVVENGTIVLTMRVVVGKKDNPTPIFSDELTHIVFSPYWNIPESIAKQETIPAILKDRKYTHRQNIEILQGSGQGTREVDPAKIDWSHANEIAGLRFRQRPGPGNSLGQVKFVFPNHHDVYLHDSPAATLFQRIERDFSHGCIRIERPFDLALYVLNDQPDWPAEKIESAMNAGSETTVVLKKSLPVHIQYWTAWVDNQGTLQFRDDIYGHDSAHAQVLARLSKSAQNDNSGG